MKKIKHNYLFLLFVYAVLYFVSKTFFSGLYMFRWTASNHYWFSWVLVLYFVFMNKDIVARMITWGNIIGIVAGQVIGDLIQKYNATFITPNMDVQEKYMLLYHEGPKIYVLFLVSFIILGLFFERKNNLTH